MEELLLSWASLTEEPLWIYACWVGNPSSMFGGGWHLSSLGRDSAAEGQVLEEWHEDSARGIKSGGVCVCVCVGGVTESQ